MKIKALLLVVLSGLIIPVFGQKVFSEKSDQCSPNFFIEDDQILIQYSPDDSIMVVDLLNGLDQKYTDKLTGTVLLQVMIDTSGLVCLVSYSNNTNLTDKRFNLSTRIPSMPGWPKIVPYQDNTALCTLIAITFSTDDFVVQRYGYNRNTGKNLLSTNTYLRLLSKTPVKPD